MATTVQTNVRVTAASALGLAVLQASLSVSGPWQPASVILGWTAVVTLGVGLAMGLTGGVAAAAFLEVVRIGIQGISGDATPGLVVSAALLVAMVETASASLEARRMPTDLAIALAQAVLGASAAGAAVAVSILVVDVAAVSSTGWRVAGLAGAVAIAMVVLGVQRRRA